jgi:5-methylcytosine-specific restriction endonuclease McrA
MEANQDIRPRMTASERNEFNIQQFNKFVNDCFRVQQGGVATESSIRKAYNHWIVNDQYSSKKLTNKQLLSLMEDRFGKSENKGWKWLVVFDNEEDMGYYDKENPQCKLSEVTIPDWMFQNNQNLDPQIEELSSNEETTRSPLSPKKYTKKSIPKAVKDIVWDKYIGKENASEKCYCCGYWDIHVRQFECGHVKPESKGGGNNPENLRPICRKCNSSMHDKDMIEYAHKFHPLTTKIPKPENLNTP